MATTPEHLTLRALLDDSDSLFKFDLPEKPSLELLTEARKAVLLEIDFVSWHVDTPELLAEELDRAVKKLIEISLARLSAESNPQDVAYLKRRQIALDQAVKRMQRGLPAQPEPEMTYDDPCPNCGSKDVYFDLLPRPNTPVDPKNPPLRCCQCHEPREDLGSP